MPGLTDIYKTIILSYAKRILELQKEIKDIDKSLDEIGEKNKEVNHLKSIPGVATKLASGYVTNKTLAIFYLFKVFTNLSTYYFNYLIL